MNREALKLALEALIGARAFLESDTPVEIWGVNDQAITAIKEALAQPEQEPIGWLDSNDKLAEFMHKDLKAEHDKRDSSTPRYFQIPVYTTPPQRTWVGLTDEEVAEVAIKSQDGISPHDDTLRFARAIEAKLKEKNT